MLTNDHHRQATPSDNVILHEHFRAVARRSSDDHSMRRDAAAECLSLVQLVRLRGALDGIHKKTREAVFRLSIDTSALREPAQGRPDV